MSFRRPATSAGSRRHMMPPPASNISQRPRSALAKSSASSSSTVPSEEMHQDNMHFTTSPSRHRLKKPIPGQDDEANIQVVIRCRRRSDREVQDASPVIVTTNGPRGEDVTIETAPPSSILGVITPPPTRTYPYDRVFGPEADQAMVYNDVVAPILEQVLTGYNCTLFAYGQTGTGKTHTMQGDLTLTHLGNPSAGAGMIPRVLFKLFQHLEAQVPDYSVKISFVELYNEELRDLLAPEVSAPLGTAQPMSLGGGQQAQTNAGLRIFDDASKRGVFIQGLEEVAVKNAADAIALLTKGSHRRQIAATKFNEHSSRSHSVFSITVHSKEASSLGDDLLKVGKLNLVDLAGSENIGRSGAENKRAREAGIINQSLLTLGRVINALVEKSSHVPYRESKLTRLLQDSLGGRTKTCIIATISPARCNMEETLSTLEYALRAKSIRNKPEINQRLTKNALLKEYVGEIERLKADLLAAREMNGIYFSQDSWDQISAEHELRQAQHEEAKRRVAITESQLGEVREELGQSLRLLAKRENELKVTKEMLRNATDELQAKKDELEVVKDALEEEIVVRKAHQEKEIALDKLATELRVTVERSIEDICGLFEKLGRKTAVAGTNAQAVSEYGQSLDAELVSMSTYLEKFAEAHNQATVKLSATVQQFHAVEDESFATHLAMINKQLHKLGDFVELMRRGESTSNDAIDVIKTAVKNAGESMKNSFNIWSVSLKQSCESLCGGIQTSGIEDVTVVEEAFKTIAGVLESLILEAHKHIQSEHSAAVKLSALARESADVEIHRLREQNALLTQLLQAEKVKSDRARDELIQRISGLLGEYTQARDQSLREAISVARQNVSAGEIAIGEFVVNHDQQVEAGVKRRREWDNSVEKSGRDGTTARDSGLKALMSVTDGFKDGLTTVQNNVVSSTTSQAAEMDNHAQNMIVTCSGAYDRLNNVKRARIDATENLNIEAQAGYQSLQHSLKSTSQHIEQTVGVLVGETSSLVACTRAYRNKSTTGLSNIKHMACSLLEKATKEETPTGTTPTKKTWEYPNRWEVSKSRANIVHEWRNRRCNSLNPLEATQNSAAPNELKGLETAVPLTEGPPDSGPAVDVDVKMEEESSASLMSPASSPGIMSSTSSQVHRNTGSNGFGKITKAPGFGPYNALRERSTNLLPSRGPRRLR